MATLFASMAVKSALDNLSSLLPAATATSTPFPATATGLGVEDLRMLEPIMGTIHATLRDAEQHWNLREESAKLRLKELKDLAYDAEDLVEEYEYEVSRCRVEALEQSAGILHGGGKRTRQEVHDDKQKQYHSTEIGIVPVPSELVHRARKIRERFIEIKEYSDTFSLSDKDGEPRIVADIHSARQTSSIVYAQRVVGREEDREQVLEKFMSESGEGNRLRSHMSVLAIVGMGGLGKTTLAQLVYNDTRMRQSFDLCAWVCVSEYFNVQSITRKIITSLTRYPCHHIQDGALQGALGDHVKEKSILLVLDDVWNERSDYWEELCMPMLASKRCDIIVTTRSKGVARVVGTMPFYNLNCLNPDDSWSLFKQAAFIAQEIAIPANLIEIGKSITGKCKGLPLAIKTLGSILRFEPDANTWRDVLESELWDLKQPRNEVFAALELSYKYMPLHLRRCFVSLSLFPKDIYLDEYRVVSLWKLFGLLLHCEGSNNEDEIGSFYFNELVQRSLLQNYIDGERVMHDLVHDLACLLAGEEFFRLEAHKPNEIPQDARYISIASRDRSIYISNNASQSLRVITSIEDADVQNPEVLFLNCKKFRIIEVTQGRLGKTTLEFIGGMKFLRHFTLYGDPEQLVLSDSVLKLFNLRTLIFEAGMLHGIGSLVNLHTLPQIHISTCGCFFDIRELRNMNNIRKLDLNGLCNLSVADTNEACLHRKKKLEILELDFNRWRSCEHTQRDAAATADIVVYGGALLESLEPDHQSIRVLRIKNFNFEKYPCWLGRASFSKLTELLLFGCQSRHLPTLGELPSLNKLVITNGMEHVEHIGREFCSLNPRVKGFFSLVHLSLYDLHRLSTWYGVEDGEFPRLEKLTIYSSFELRFLPFVPFLSLRSFSLFQCTNLSTIPMAANLQELSIAECENLRELPALPSLQSLQLWRCPNLVTLGHFPSLTILELQAPFQEEILYRLINSHLSLETLSVWCDSLMVIHLDPQWLPSLTELSLNCKNLRYCNNLASLTSLKILNVTGTPNLHIPESLRSQLEQLIVGSMSYCSNPLSIE